MLINECHTTHVFMVVFKQICYSRKECRWNERVGEQESGFCDYCASQILSFSHLFSQNSYMMAKWFLLHVLGKLMYPPHLFIALHTWADTNFALSWIVMALLILINPSLSFYSESVSFNWCEVELWNLLINGESGVEFPAISPSLLLSLSRPNRPF